MFRLSQKFQSHSHHFLSFAKTLHVLLVRLMYEQSAAFFNRKTSYRTEIVRLLEIESPHLQEIENNDKPRGVASAGSKFCVTRFIFQ